MKLWLLRQANGLGTNDPWVPWYDKVSCFVIQAKTEERAREMANENAGDEKWGAPPINREIRCNPWLDATLSTCVELLPEGEEKIVIRDYNAG